MGSKLQIFEDKKVRSYWDPEQEEWYFSAVDVCYVLAESASKDPGAYWRKLKQRLKKEGSEVVTNCHGLKLLASDGKMRLTDCFSVANTFRLIQSIPSPKAEPFKVWMAQVAAERLDEIADPEKAILQRRRLRSWRCPQEYRKPYWHIRNISSQRLRQRRPGD